MEIRPFADNDLLSLARFLAINFMEFLMSERGKSVVPTYGGI